MIDHRLSGLVDANGKPIPRDLIATLREETSPPGAAYARPPFSGHMAFGMTPEQLGEVVRSADAGSTLAFMTLAEEVEELYTHYAAVLSKRKRAVQQLPITVEAAGDGPNERVHAEVLRAWLNSGVVQRATFDILDAVGKGYSVCEIIWENGAAGIRPAAFDYRPQRWFEISWKNGRDLWLRTEAGFQEDLSPHKFLVHRHPFKSGMITRSGLTRAVVFLWMYAAYTQRDWQLFQQGYGMPMRLGKYGRGASEGDKRVLWQAVSSIAGDVAAIVPDSMQVEFVTGKGGGAGGHDLFLKRADWLDRAVSKLVLGGTAGTDAIAGGHAVGQEHREVEGDVERFDAALLGTTLTGLGQTIIAFNFGAQTAYPVVRVGRPDEVPLPQLIAGVGDLAGLGLTVKASEIRARLQLSEPDADDEIIGGRAPDPAPALQKPTLPLPPGGPVGVHAARGLFGRLVTLHAAQAPELVEALTERVAEEAAGALAGLQETIRAEFDAATSMEDLAERLSKLRLDPAAFAQAMQRALALAHLAGQAELLTEVGMAREGRHQVAHHAALTPTAREDLPAADFAVPGKRALPMHDARHVRLAWDMVDTTEGLSGAERRAARRRILARARRRGVDTSAWEGA